MDTESFTINIKAEDFYKDIANDAKIRFDTSSYDVSRPSPKGKNKKVIELMKDKSGGKIMTEFVALWPETCSYLMDNSNSDNKAKRRKKSAIKGRIKFSDYKDCLLNNKMILKSRQKFKSQALYWKNDQVYTKL